MNHGCHYTVNNQQLGDLFEILQMAGRRQSHIQEEESQHAFKYFTGEGLHHHPPILTGNKSHHHATEKEKLSAFCERFS